LFPPEIKKINHVLSQSTVVKLGDAVTVFRPIGTIKNQDDTLEKVSTYELTVSDFPRFGYLRQPVKTIEFSKSELSKKNLEAFLKPFDVLIVAKGSVGKVAIVPENVPSAGEGGWMVNQSCLILRVDREIIDPRALLMYLRSEIGQFLLGSMVSGATIPLIQLRSLTDLKVIIPSHEESQNIINAFEHQIEFQSEIDSLKQKQIDLDKLIWSI
jgi:type I restriction enzyme M protein